MAGLSDSNTRRPSASNVAFRKVYSDVPLAFKEHPVKKDIRPLNDLDAVKQSIKNIILTNQGERPFQLSIGGNVTRYLFEPLTPFTAFSLEEEILRTISRNEPRVRSTKVKVSADIDRNTFDVTIGFNVDFSSNREEVSFALERLR
jgi:phage baseplate assembly protein W